MSIVSPFKFGKVVTGASFVNREHEKSRIRNNILSRNNTIIISSRRWGKSSLMRQVASEVGTDKIRFVFIDVYNVRTEEDFFTSYSREIIKATITRKEEILNLAKGFFKRIIPVISFSVDPLHDLSVKFNWAEAKEAVDEIINLPEKIAREMDIQIIVCIDEFQNIARINDYLRMEETLRTYWQNHEHASYCIYGSKKHMMLNIFNQESRPFYHFGDLIMLGKISENHWIDFISSRFNTTGKLITKELTESLILAAGNQPEYVQQLAHYTWTLTSEIADKNSLNKAIDMLISTNGLFYQEVCEGLSNTQINLIRAVVKGEIRFTSAEIMLKYSLGTPRNVSKNKIILEEKDIIEFSIPMPDFKDPFFKIWFKMKF